MKAGNLQAIPEAGKVYVSRTIPAIRMYVKAVRIVEDNEELETEGCFVVEACDPADNGGGIRYELTSDEWAEYGFGSESESPAR